MTDYTKPEQYDPSDWQQVQRRQAEQQTQRKNAYTASLSDYDDAPSISRGQPRPGSFVAPAPIVPARRQPVIEILPPAEHEQGMVRNAPTGGTMLRTQVNGTYRDRAEGFQIASFPLSVGAGILAVILAIVGFGRPFGLGLLLWFSMAFFATWLIAWAVHNAVSAEGIALVRELSLWAYLKREQRERWDWQWSQVEREED